jgi:hypothetical protein
MGMQGAVLLAGNTKLKKNLSCLNFMLWAELVKNLS